MIFTKTIKISHYTEEIYKTTLVNWCLGNTCNFKCSYCPDSLHSGSIRWVNYSLALSFCTKLITHYNATNQKIEFLFTGGEPTLYPQFPKLLTELKKQGCTNTVISNGSRTIKWWEKNIHLFDKIILTFHSEFAEREHFFKLVEFLKDKVDLHINFTMLPSNFEYCLNTAKSLFEISSNISITLKPLLKEFGDKMYDYTEEQLLKLKEVRFKSTKNYFPSRGLMKKTFENGLEEKCKAVDFILNNENHWKGWNCNIGIELLYIDYKGDVYRGTCQQDGRITNIHNDELFEFPRISIICRKETCHCLTDIMVTRSKVGEFYGTHI